MPKGKASERKQKQAGAAAVPTAAHTHDADARAAYQQLKSEFTKALDRAGAPREVAAEVESLCKACFGRKGPNYFASIMTTAATIFMHHLQPPFGGLVSLYVRRALTTTGIFTSALDALKSKDTSAREAKAIIMLLMTIQSGDPMAEFRDLSHIPPECFPVPHTYEVLAAKQWHPQILAVTCRALLNTHEMSQSHQIKAYLANLHSPYIVCPPTPQDSAILHMAMLVDCRPIMESQECMNTIWEVLQHPEHTVDGVNILCALVQLSDINDDLPVTFSKLLRVGGAKPLTIALRHHLKKTTELQKQGELYFRKGGPLGALVHLLFAINKSVTLDWERAEQEHKQGCKQCAAEQAPWPKDLLQAHLPSQIKIIELTPQIPKASLPKLSDASSLHIYPEASLPSAARILSRNREALHALVDHIACTANIATAGPDPIEAVEEWRAGMKFIHSLTNPEHEGSAAELMQALPVIKLSAPVVLGIEALVTAVMVGIEAGMPDHAAAGNTPDFIRTSSQLLLRLTSWPPDGDELRDNLGPEYMKAVEELARESLSVPAVRAAAGACEARRRRACVGVDGAASDVFGKSVFGASSGRACGRGAEHAGSERAAPHSSSRNSSSNATTSATTATRAAAAPVAPEAKSDAGPVSSIRGAGSGSGSGGDASKRPNRTCAGCGYVGKGLKACSKCQAAFFCNQECQRVAWPQHRMVCVPRQ